MALMVSSQSDLTPGWMILEFFGAVESSLGDQHVSEDNIKSPSVSLIILGLWGRCSQTLAGEWQFYPLFHIHCRSFQHKHYQRCLTLPYTFIHISDGIFVSVTLNSSGCNIRIQWEQEAGRAWCRWCQASGSETWQAVVWRVRRLN